ncbi:MAG: carboxypeptidase regulatory-like domain-containing protein, partial [Planctomycetota bacterium]
GGAVAANVPVMLLESALNDPVQMFLNNKLGKTSPPLASALTAPDGTFALGLRKVGKGVDLRVVSEEHPEFHLQQIKVREGDWYDAKDVQLEAGVAVSGRVVETNTKTPVANATVYLASSHQSHAMLATPGRERGVPTTTSPDGTFRFANGPRQGLVNLVAEAQGYATAQILNQQLRTDGANDFTLEVELGQPIAGVVVDANGQPVGNVTVNANGLSSKTPQAGTAVTGSDGTFQFASLRAGPYQLTTASPQHAEAKAPLVMTGEMEVKIVLATRGSVRLKVLAANGQALKSYRVSLKRWFPNNPLGIANVMDWPDRSITPADYPTDFGGEFALVKGLPAGDFRFQLTDAVHAKTLSPGFTIVEGGPPAEVIATLTLGGAIIGTVTDDRGTPIADAVIATDMNGGIAADTGLFDIFRTMMPEKHTKATARTDAQGRFRISKLAFAEYMVRASHPNYCEGSSINLKLENEGQVVDAGVIQLALGAVLEGLTFIGGEPAGQVKVTVSTPMNVDTLPSTPKDGTPAPSQQPSGPARVLFNATVQSDGDGRFRLLKRVPPGTYKVVASRPGSGNDVFSSLLDMKESAQEVTVAPGQETVTLTFNLGRR